MDEAYRALQREALSPVLEENILRFRRLLRGEINSDAQFRRFVMAGRPACVIYMEGMADDRKLSEFVLRAGEAASVAAGGTEDVMRRVVEIAQCEPEGRVEQILDAIVTGRSALLLEGCDEAILLETRGYPARPVGRTVNESVVIGAQEGFVENLRTNMTLMRRYLASPRLITEMITVGRDAPCRVCMVYLEGTADPGVIDEVRRRLKRIDAPSVQGLGAVQQLIEDAPWAVLPQALQTERPDRAAACALDGQVVLLADNSPCALALPVTLFHLIHASDDAFARWQYGTFLRLIRVMGMVVSVFLPGLYIALTDYHMHLLPLSLVGSIAEARANVPFPILAEILIMELSFYLINEAGTRMPQQIGPALGIVGALILGQAAVSASIISPILIIIVAITGLGNYVIPNYGFGIGLVLCRLFVIFWGAALGLYGISIAAFCLLVGLCAMRSLGFPYLLPIAPRKAHNPDLLTRLPIWLQRRRLLFGSPKRREGERPCAR